jgi:exo-beta-1,3-glucanase (GH17 family)
MEDGIDVVPRLAQKYGLYVTAGAWLDGRLDRNRREISALIDNVWRYSNINRVIVGNEAILRDDLSVQEVTTYLRIVRSRINIPVSTAEPWDIWLKHPEL